MHQNDFEQYIRQQAHHLNLPLSLVAKKSDMSRHNLYKLLAGNAVNARMSTLVKLAYALQVHPMELIRHAFEEIEFPSYTNTSNLEPNDASGFIRDVTIPDNTIVKSGQYFIKTWEIQNIGNINWKDRFLLCVDEHLEVSSSNTDFLPPTPNRYLVPKEKKTPIANLEPGQTTQISVEFTAPNIPGSCISYWKMTDNEGTPFFPNIEGLSCQVQILYI